jgi:hypothetical protein
MPTRPRHTPHPEVLIHNASSNTSSEVANSIRHEEQSVFTVQFSFYNQMLEMNLNTALVLSNQHHESHTLTSLFQINIATEKENSHCTKLFQIYISGQKALRSRLSKINNSIKKGV